MFFEYGETETEYLKSKDSRLAEVVEKVGHIDRASNWKAIASHILAHSARHVR